MTTDERIQRLGRLLDYLWDCATAGYPVMLDDADHSFLQGIASSRNEPDGFSVTFDDGTLLDVIVLEGTPSVDL